MFRLTKKKLVLGAATVCVMAIAAGAYAYFNTTGTGTATATVGSGAAVTLKGTVSGTLYPGSESTVNFTVDNPSKSPQLVRTISLEKITPDTQHKECQVTVGEATTNAFYMAPVAANQQFAPNTTGVAVTQTGTLKMRNLEESQDKCQGAQLTLTLTSN